VTWLAATGDNEQSDLSAADQRRLHNASVNGMVDG